MRWKITRYDGCKHIAEAENKIIKKFTYFGCRVYHNKCITSCFIHNFLLCFPSDVRLWETQQLKDFLWFSKTVLDFKKPEISSSFTFDCKMLLSGLFSELIWSFKQICAYYNYSADVKRFLAVQLRAIKKKRNYAPYLKKFHFCDFFLIRIQKYSMIQHIIHKNRKHLCVSCWIISHS